MILTIICPTYNEESFIENAINSFLNQKCSSFTLEILICDGMSTDATRSIVSKMASANSQIRLVDNPNRLTPFAFNIGLKEAKGDYIAILGAHSFYKNDYVEVCYRELIDKGAIGCSGRILTKPANSSFQARVCAWIGLSWFGVSGKSFRLADEGYTESIGYPIFYKDALINIGGYNEALPRNQDNDLNQRLIEAGHRLYVTAKTDCFYFPSSTIVKFIHYAYRNGKCVASTMFINPRSMKYHHLIPFGFSSAILILSIIGLCEYFVNNTHFLFQFLGYLLFLHIFLGLISAISISEKKYFILRILLMPLIIFCFHFSYGWGTISGFFLKYKEKFLK